MYSLLATPLISIDVLSFDLSTFLHRAPTPHASPQERLRECYLRSGVNHIEDCKEFRETLWKKMNTYNYGAPGPERGTARYR